MEVFGELRDHVAQLEPLRSMGWNGFQSVAPRRLPAIEPVEAESPS
jgi:hypothetical protein